jgi:hypothetical protein
LKPKRPNSDQPAKEPPEPCPFCGADTKRSSKIVPGAVILKCLACQKMGVKESVRSDWIEIAHHRAVEWLVHVVEQQRRWAHMLVDPHNWTDFSGNALDDDDY